jgi:hypothetical protein
MYPRLHFENKFSWLSPPSVGKILVLVIYWSLITFMMTHQAIIYDSEYYERIGFRASWIGLAQVPLVYLLSTKSSAIACLVGSSYERLNWLHRWVAITLLTTITVHGGAFIREWIQADFLTTELKMMPMVKYGIGAWAVLLWTLLSSLSPLRYAAYEFFVQQHIASALVFLWLVWVHIPKHACYFVWISIGAVSSDWFFRCILLLYQNILRGGIGYHIQLEAADEDTTVLYIEDVPLSWKPGQHLRLWIPRLGFWESHPYTMATSSIPGISRGSKNRLDFVVRTASGISKRINTFARRPQVNVQAKLTVFISGPYGTPPKWNSYETLILIAASTGGSFTLPILENVINDPLMSRVRRVRFLLIARRKSHIEFYMRRISTLVTRNIGIGIDLAVEIAITGGESRDDECLQSDEDEQILLHGCEMDDIEEVKWLDTQVYPNSTPACFCGDTSNAGEGDQDTEHTGLNPMNENPALFRGLIQSRGRPSISYYIRGSVEDIKNEASVVVCGGRSLVSEVKNCVASLLRERSTCKEGGPRFIDLYSEEYTI